VTVLAIGVTPADARSASVQDDSEHYVYHYGMHNDNHNVLYVRRSIPALIAGAAALLGSVLVTAVSAINLGGVLEMAQAGEVILNVPLNPEATAEITTSWTLAGAEAYGTSFVTAFIPGAPEMVVAQATTATVVSSGTAIVIALAVTAVTVLGFAGRLRWSWLPRVTATLGALVVAGSVSSQLIATGAAEQISSIAQSGDTWTEPGFIAGIDWTMPLAGLFVLVISVVLGQMKTLASEADGVV
jgi:hypothetical protein